MHFLQPLLEPGADCSLKNERTGELVALHLEPAFDSKSRRTGLLGREQLDAGTALIIAPGEAIHTFFMRFPIDVIFVSKAGTVRKIKRRLKPWRIAACFGSFATIELASDALEHQDLKVGDRLFVAPRQG